MILPRAAVRSSISFSAVPSSSSRAVASSVGRASAGVPTPSPNSSQGSPVAIPTSNTPAVQQSDNMPGKWSASQQQRSLAWTGPRFEQTKLEFQPNPLSAMELISKVPVTMVAGRKAICDGGGGALGHPKVFINLDQPGARSCHYCGLRYEQDAHHHTAH